MHMQTVDEKISPVTAAMRQHGVQKYADEESRRHWRKMRNGGRKVKTLRTKRVGR